MYTNRLPVQHATAEQSRALHRTNLNMRELLGGFSVAESADVLSSAAITPAIMDTCMNGVVALEKIVESTNKIFSAKTFFEDFPLIAREAYQESASSTLMSVPNVGAITRALIERNRVSGGPKSKIEALHRARKYSQKREDKFQDYVASTYKDTVIQDGIMEATRTIGALIEIAPHLVAQKGLNQTISGLREHILFRSARSMFPIVNRWVRTTRENDIKLIHAIERPSVGRDDSNPHDKYKGMRFDPSAFVLDKYRITFVPDIWVESDDRKSFGCPTNHNAHTIRLFRVMLIAAAKSGALQYVANNSDRLLSE